MFHLKMPFKLFTHVLLTLNFMMKLFQYIVESIHLKIVDSKEILLSDPFVLEG